MEGVSWAMHKYVMHGAFWFLHEDHHTKDHHKGIFELNDWFFVFFAVLSMSFYGMYALWAIKAFLGIGIGITIYGAIYLLIHDLFIHQRIKIWRNTTNPYLLAIRRAHKIHHKHLGKHHGECFGMLWVPLKYYKQYFNSAT
jgi:beta-carotene 3-hydroxylase